MQSDPDLLAQAKAEAEAIIEEARDQARRLSEAADERRKTIDPETEDVRAAGTELARNLERSIALLSQVLEELKRHLA